MNSWLSRIGEKIYKKTTVDNEWKTKKKHVLLGQVGVCQLNPKHQKYP